MNSLNHIKNDIEKGACVLGMELGSTRIKLVLLGSDHRPVASGSYHWENHLEDGIWTYPLEEAWKGIQEGYRSLCCEVEEKYQVKIRTLKAIGVSAMMHGYLPFDKNGNLLSKFCTWRNTNTAGAADILTDKLQFQIPLRWSVAHLYQNILRNESHVRQIHYITTLAGYVHWKLTGEKVLGVNDASGMFPVDTEAHDYDAEKIRIFDQMIRDKEYCWKLKEILPNVLYAGEYAGKLTEEGAKRIDPGGTLQPGIPFCPPEGDAGTGMVATNSIGTGQGNISAGTSMFAMIVLDKALSQPYPEVDMVVTPDGKNVAMIHCNNGSSDIDAWANVFWEFIKAMKMEYTYEDVIGAIYAKAAEGSSDCGDIYNYNCLSGEPVSKIETGRPMLVRKPDSIFSFANFSRSLLYGAVAGLKTGIESLIENEKLEIKNLVGHGGFFKTSGAGQRIMASALHIPVSTLYNADLGGPNGMAILAAYMAERDEGESLEDFLSGKIYGEIPCETVMPEEEECRKFNQYMKNYKRGLEAERAAANIV